jgi:hypothetical protein
MRYLLVAAPLFFAASVACAKEQVLDAKLHHLRVTKEREWTDFPEQAEAPSLVLRFPAKANAAEQSLRLRQQDVKQTWKIILNGQERGRLQPCEDDMVIYLPLPAGALTDGENTLRIEQVGRAADDIRVGEIALDDRPARTVLSEGRVKVVVTEAGRPVPSRLTVLNAQGALATVGAKSGNGVAVRPGVLYTGDGKATFGLPAGKYQFIAGRGPEYGIARAQVMVRAGEVVEQSLTIRREVPRLGYVSCDTHVHTLTFSGHGDSSIEERMITLAGEGIELPIATDHNVHVDYQKVATKTGMRRYFTPVIGNEVTTPVGHFCVFPVPAKAPIPDYKLKDWKGTFASIAEKTAARVVILNHPRDLHGGFRPFGPKRHNAATGENLDGWILRANAMEVINSGAIQSDPMLVYRDWFAMLNRGLFLTPVGASDSHDVARSIVGQGRTYIRVKNDAEPGKIDVNEAVTNLLAGRVTVSLGLRAEITVNEKYGPGDLVPAVGQPVKVRVRVLGPSWVTADKVELFANGRKIQEATIAEGKKAGVKWAGEWSLPAFKHDVHLAAIASGPAMKELFWPIESPYQPASPPARSGSTPTATAGEPVPAITPCGWKRTRGSRCRNRCKRWPVTMKPWPFTSRRCCTLAAFPRPTRKSWLRPRKPARPSNAVFARISRLGGSARWLAAIRLVMLRWPVRYLAAGNRVGLRCRQRGRGPP